jgi:hypothetical protein
MKRADRVKYLATIVTIIVALAVVTAILILDPPSVQRQRKLDTKRIRDLTNISHSIDSYWERKKSLPPDLATLEREPGLKIPLKDPETGVAYVYELTSSKSYRLCAVFSLDSSDESQECNSCRKWSHGAGRQCFDLKPPKSEDKGDKRQSE